VSVGQCIALLKAEVERKRELKRRGHISEVQVDWGSYRNIWGKTDAPVVAPPEVQGQS
jgi:hypothetical protein